MIVSRQGRMPRMPENHRRRKRQKPRPAGGRDRSVLVIGGRCQTDWVSAYCAIGFRHGVVGSVILRKEGHPQEALIAERHLGPGISREDILEQDLDLPHQDFIPESYEEKIVCYADKLISGVKEITIEESKKRFKKEIGEKCEARLQALHEEISELRGL